MIQYIFSHFGYRMTYLYSDACVLGVYGDWFVRTKGWIVRIVPECWNCRGVRSAGVSLYQK